MAANSPKVDTTLISYCRQVLLLIRVFYGLVKVCTDLRQSVKNIQETKCMCVCVRVRACVRVCVCVYVRACARVYECMSKMCIQFLWYMVQ